MKHKGLGDFSGIFTCRRCKNKSVTSYKRSFDLQLCGGCLMEIKISNARLGFWVEFLDRNRSAWRLTEKGATKLARYWMVKEQDAGNNKGVSVIHNEIEGSC